MTFNITVQKSGVQHRYLPRQILDCDIKFHGVEDCITVLKTSSYANQGVHSEQVKDNWRLWDELETKSTIIKLLIENLKQLADSIGKSNTTASLLQTPNFSENNNFTMPKN